MLGGCRGVRSAQINSNSGIDTTAGRTPGCRQCVSAYMLPGIKGTRSRGREGLKYCNLSPPIYNVCVGVVGAGIEKPNRAR